MIVKCIFLLSLLVYFRINAQNLTANIEIPIGADYTSIHFRMNRFDVKFYESGSSKVIISGIKDRGQWNFHKDREGGLVIEEKEYENKLFATSIQNKEHLIIKVPVLPLLVVGNDLDLTFENMKNNIRILIIKGFVKGFKTQGEMRAFVNTGEVHLDRHSGALFLNGSQVKFSMKNSSSDAKVNNYSGTVLLEKNTGHSSIFNYQGTITLTQVTGSSQIELSKGSVQVSQSQGRHDILTDEASIDLKATKESDFNVKMKNGKLSYQSAGVTGTWLNLNSKEADIFLPAPLKPQKVKAEVFFKGRTSGEKSSSRLEAKSVNAPIIVK